VLCVARDDFLELVRGSWDLRHQLLSLSQRHAREKKRRMLFRRTHEEADYDDDSADYYDDGKAAPRGLSSDSTDS
jgi:hypothetical protein